MIADRIGGHRTKGVYANGESERKQQAATFAYTTQLISQARVKKSMYAKYAKTQNRGPCRAGVGEEAKRSGFPFARSASDVHQEAAGTTVCAD